MRRFSHQHAEAILCPAVAGSQNRNQRFGRPEVRGRLLNVQFGDQALLFPHGNDPQRFLSEVRGSFGKFQTLFVGPHLDVVCGHLGLQKHQHVVVAFDLGVEIDVGRLDRAAETPPEIEFPCSVKAGRPVVVIVFWQRKKLNG